LAGTLPSGSPNKDCRHGRPKGEKKMDANHMIAAVKQHPEYPNAGMILLHNGVVRATSRDGRRVTGLRIQVDRDRLESVLEENRQRPGIIDIQVKIAEDQDLTVGDDVMMLVVAGDIRENVISVLKDTLHAIKSTVTRKTEFFVAAG
jgi:molybdopterin synthase catalytic subunit